MEGKIVVAKVSVLLQEAILKKEVDGTSAMAIVARGMEMMQTFPNMTGSQKKEMLVEVVKNIAAGKDGVMGTEDDIIPKECVEALKALLEKDLVGQLTSVILDASKGKFQLEKAVAVADEAKKSLLPAILACFAFLKKKKATAKATAGTASVIV